ncbi:MAG: hypothetical protein KC621_20690 [Myxococcales bacterium]|nr:hypothetical protein [Myxococcales bacterium]
MTWDTLAVQVMSMGTGDWNGKGFGFQDSSSRTMLAEFSPQVPAVWTQQTMDTSAMCGQDVWLDLASTPDHDRWYSYSNPDSSTESFAVDDFGWLGQPCPQFVDTNGNGLCREGIDLDADGLCVDGDEPTPGTVQDPNE